MAVKSQSVSCPRSPLVLPWSEDPSVRVYGCIHLNPGLFTFPSTPSYSQGFLSQKTHMCGRDMLCPMFSGGERWETELILQLLL